MIGQVHPASLLTEFKAIRDTSALPNLLPHCDRKAFPIDSLEYVQPAMEHHTQVQFASINLHLTSPN